MRTVLIGFAALGLCFAACSSEKPPEPVVPTPTSTPAIPDNPVPSAVASATPASSDAPDAGAAPRPSSGRTPVLKSDPVEITDTFGYSPAAKLEIGEKDFAVFRIPENALKTATNITFKLDTKGKSGGGQVGKIYHLIAIVPPSTSATELPTNGPPFELTLPAGTKKDANLAIGTIGTDDKGREKIKWTIIKPIKIDDATGTAHFELQSVGDMFLHITTKPPQEAK